MKIIQPGMIFGKLVIKEKSTVTGKGTLWICLCICGKVTEVSTSKLNFGSTKSCGCHRGGKNTHNLCRKYYHEYKTWCAMKQRCLIPSHPSYHNYGGRGICICNEWVHHFEIFLKDLGPRPPGMTLERKDNSEGYSAENCVWASRGVQSRNRRGLIKFEFRGAEYLIIEFCEKFNITRSCFNKRKALGWSLEEMVQGYRHGKCVQKNNALHEVAKPISQEKVKNAATYTKAYYDAKRSVERE